MTPGPHVFRRCFAHRRTTLPFSVCERLSESLMGHGEMSVRRPGNDRSLSWPH